jgi:hypothetical protein
MFSLLQVDVITRAQACARKLNILFSRTQQPEQMRSRKTRGMEKGGREKGQIVTRHFKALSSNGLSTFSLTVYMQNNNR